MVYANVIVGSRTYVQELTYSVPAAIIPYITPGSTVSVPLRRQQVRAVVVKLTRNIAKEVKPFVKDIIDVDKSGIGFSELQIKTIEDLAKYYGASQAEVAYHALLWPHKINKNNYEKNNQPTFIQALWPDRKEFYLELINKFINYCKEKNIEIIKLGTAKGERILSERLASGEKFICIGLQKTAFVSLEPGDFLIIDSPNSISFKQQRRPYMSNKTIALFRASNEKIKLIFGANLLSVEDYPRRLDKSWRVIEKKLPAIDISIHDKRRSKDFILPSIIEEIGGSNSVLFMLASKAWAPAVICKNCNEVLKCPRCERTISLLNKTTLGCLYCGYNSNLPIECPNCSSKELFAVGEGSIKLFENLKNIYGQENVGLISSLSKEKSEKPFVVATEKILSFPQMSFDVAVIANMDRLLSGTDYSGTWHMLNILMHLRTISKRIIVQTQLPEHWIWKTAGIGDAHKYFKKELEDRKAYTLPPYGQKITIIGTGSLSSLKSTSIEISESIENNIKNLDIGELQVFNRDKGKFVGRLDAYASKNLSINQKQLIRKLLPPSWYLDIESL